MQNTGPRKQRPESTPNPFSPDVQDEYPGQARTGSAPLPADALDRSPGRACRTRGRENNALNQPQTLSVRMSRMCIQARTGSAPLPADALDRSPGRACRTRGRENNAPHLQSTRRGQMMPGVCVGEVGNREGLGIRGSTTELQG